MNLNDKKILIVGSGLYGAVWCDILTSNYNCDVTIIDKRDHIGGNIYTYKENNIDIHKYGPHIFHTNEKRIWEYITKFDDFLPYIQETLAKDKYGNLYHLPFNMNTFYDIYKAITPSQAKEYIQNDIVKYDNPKNLEEQALSTVGIAIYEILIKNYTEKQWGKKCTELSPDVIKRLPLRFEFNNNYFNDKYQGIPKHGYSYIIEQMICNAKNIILNEDFNNDREEYINNYNLIIYTGAIDELLDYVFGQLEWRSLKFENVLIDKNDTQGCSIINDVSINNAYTRTIEHCYFTGKQNENDHILRTYEYPNKWDVNSEKYYPINNDFNNELYNKYLTLLNEKYPTIMIGGRLGKYKYFDMDDTILEAFNDINKLLCLN